MNENLGPTGQFPDGKIDPNDEGELKLAIGIQNNNVILDFGTQVMWIGLGKEDALAIAESLIKHANMLT